MSDKPPYRVKIEPTFGIQARVRVWHQRTLLLDRTVWALDVRERAECVARVAIARDRAERRARAHEHHPRK